MPDGNLVVASYLTLAAATAAGWVLFGGQSRNHWADRALAWYLWHWTTGGPLEPRRTFAELDDPRPAWRRHTRRVLVAAGRTIPLLLIGPVRVLVVVGGSWLVVHVAMRVAHYRQWIRPLHWSVHKLAGWSEHKRPGSYIKVTRAMEHAEPRAWRRRLPERWRFRGNGIVVGVSPGFDWKKKRKEQLISTVEQVLAIKNAVPTPVPTGRHSYFQFRPEKPMPATAMFTDPDIRGLLEAAKSSAPVIGVKRGGKPVAVDLDSESPHILLSAGTGGGKTSTIRTLVSQLMANGAAVSVFDIKRHSLRFLRGLPNVRYHRDLGDMHKALCELGQEAHRRNKAWDDVGIDERGPVFNRHIIVCEEMNATMNLLRDWWKNHREPGDPPTSPAVRSLGQILYMGRAVRVHVLAVAQMATAQDMGGSAARENYATRILARYTSNNAKMLVPECALPASTRHPGRAQVCIGGVATETQLLYMTDREARAYVLDAVGQHELDVAEVADAVSLGKQPTTVVGVAAPEREAVGPAPVTLRYASSDFGVGIVMWKLHSLRRAILRAEEIGEAPQRHGRDGSAYLYDPHDLQRFELGRPRERSTGTIVEPANEDVGDVRMERTIKG